MRILICPSLYGHLKHKISRFEKVIYKIFINSFLITEEGVWFFCLKNSLQSIYIFNWYTVLTYKEKLVKSSHRGCTLFYLSYLYITVHCKTSSGTFETEENKHKH